MLQSSDFSSSVNLFQIGYSPRGEDYFFSFRLSGESEVEGIVFCTQIYKTQLSHGDLYWSSIQDSVFGILLGVDGFGNIEVLVVSPSEQTTHSVHLIQFWRNFTFPFWKSDKKRI